MLDSQKEISGSSVRSCVLNIMFDVHNNSFLASRSGGKGTTLLSLKNDIHNDSSVLTKLGDSPPVVQSKATLRVMHF